MILVTGGAGFIGSHFARPDDVVLDALTYAGNRDSVPCELVVGDIGSPGLVRSVFERFKPDAVVHFAAESHVDRSIEDPGVFVQTNIVGTFVLLEECRRTGARFVHVSTDEVYGSLEFDSPRFTERSNLNPSSPYSASKAAADCLVNAYRKTYGLDAVVVHCSNNYGPRQHVEKLVPKTIASIKSGKDMTVHGDGRDVRDWIYVEDCCDAIRMVLERGEGVYNVGAENERTNLEVVETIIRLMGRGSYVFRGTRLGHDRRYALDNSRLKYLGWRPKTSFEDGLRKTIEWYERL